MSGHDETFLPPEEGEAKHPPTPAPPHFGRSSAGTPAVAFLTTPTQPGSPGFAGPSVASEAEETMTPPLPKRSGAPGRPPSMTWGTFLRMHLAGTIAIDFLTVPTVTFQVLYVFFVLSLERRRILHVNLTAHPYAAWAAQQIVVAVHNTDAHLPQICRACNLRHIE